MGQGTNPLGAAPRRTGIAADLERVTEIGYEFVHFGPRLSVASRCDLSLTGK